MSATTATSRDGEPTASRHAWLFKTAWVEFDAGEIEDADTFDFQAREKRIRELRLAALQEIAASKGADGVLELARLGEAAWAIGLLSLDVFGVDELALIVMKAARNGLAEAPASDRQVVGAALQVLPISEREALFKAAREELSLDEAAAFISLAPFEPPTWSWIAAAGDELRAAYWKGVPPQFLRESAEEASTAIEQLLEAKRPLAAFASIRFFIEEMDPELLFRLLSAMALTDEDIGTYRIDGYDLAKAFERLAFGRAARCVTS